MFGLLNIIDAEKSETLAVEVKYAPKEVIED